MNETNRNEYQNSPEQTPQAHNNEAQDTEGKRFPLWASLLALFGILVVVVIAAIGIVRIAGDAEGNLSRLGSGIADVFRGDERIELSVEEPAVQSGEEVVLGIDHRNRADEEGIGSYAIAFECDEEEMAVLLGEVTVDCNEPFTLQNKPEQDVALTLTLAEESAERIDVPVSVAYQSEETDLSSEIILTVTREDEEDSNGTPEDEEAETDESDEEDGDQGDQTNGSETPAYQPAEPQRVPDLAVAVLANGRMEDGEFVKDETIDKDDRAAVRFLVSNSGTASTGPWTYNAILPLEEPELYQSETQESLNPGDRKSFTLEFDNIHETDGEARFYLSIDPVNRIQEITELNNFARVEFQF